MCCVDQSVCMVVVKMLQCMWCVGHGHVCRDFNDFCASALIESAMVLQDTEESSEEESDEEEEEAAQVGLAVS